MVGGFASALAKPALAVTGAQVRSLALNNLHTGERLKVDYWVEGDYVPDALESVNRVLRDFRTGSIYPIERSLLDLLSNLRQRLDSRAELHVISGYRSPVTNAKLHEASSGVAKNSLHMKGMAIDIRIPGCELSDLRRAALSLHAGGVGYYPKSNFVHVDVGRMRTW